MNLKDENAKMEEYTNNYSEKKTSMLSVLIRRLITSFYIFSEFKLCHKMNFFNHKSIITLYIVCSCNTFIIH